MRLTRLARGVVVLIALLAAMAVLFDRPMLLVGSTAVGAWLLLHQYWFTQTVTEAVSSISVDQRTTTPAVHAGTEMPVSLSVDHDTPTGTTLNVRAGVPPGGRADSPLEVTLDQDEPTATETALVSWPIAGTHDFQQARVTVSTRLFTQTFETGTQPVVRVEPRTPKNVHVGIGGEEVTASLGEHSGGFLGSTLEIAEVREYQPGDSAKLIDWNATARLGSPFVREYESEQDRASFIIIDTRASLWDGPPAESKVDYLREVGLGFVAESRQQSDSIGLLTISESGTETWIQPGSTRKAYERIRRELFELRSSPSTGVHERAGKTKETGVATSEFYHPHNGFGPTRGQLEGRSEGDARFIESLEPFFGRDSPRQTAPLRTTSFVGAIRGVIRQQDRPFRAVLCTDDAHPDEIMAAVREIREAGHQLIILLTPSFLFEPGSLTDLEEAYERYITFEAFRRDLDRLDNVVAFEVGPGNRLNALLGEHRPRAGGHSP